MIIKHARVIGVRRPSNGVRIVEIEFPVTHKSPSGNEFTINFSNTFDDEDGEFQIGDECSVSVNKLV